MQQLGYCSDTYKGWPKCTMCASSITCSNVHLPSKETFLAKISKPRSVNGSTKFKPTIALFKGSSNGEMNWDILPVVDRKRVNRGRRDKVWRSSARTLKFDQFPSFCARWVKPCASSMTRIIRGASLETWSASDCTLFFFFCFFLVFTWGADGGGSSLAFRDSMRLWQEAARGKSWPAAFGRIGEV